MRAPSINCLSELQLLTHKYITIFFISIFLTGCGSEDTSESNIIGQWQSEESPFNGQLKTDTWTFSYNGSFTRSRALRNPAGQTLFYYSNGEYTTGDDYQSDSGLTIKKLDLIYYGNNTNEPEQKDPNANYTTYLDTFYINENTLYFGILKALDTCDGEYYLTVSENIIIINGQVVNTENSGECYARPSSINFDTPHFKLTNAD